MNDGIRIDDFQHDPRPAVRAVGKDDPPAVKIFSAVDLQAEVFPPIRWAIEGYVVEGATLLGGSPKIGKSWMVLEWSLAVAGGTKAFGSIPCDPGDVLYLALEDNKRRLQDRIGKLLDGGAPPSRLDFATEWPLAHMGGLDQIEQWLRQHPKARLVTIDTLAGFRKPGGSRAGIYAEDHKVTDDLTKLADRHNVALVAVTHLVKSRLPGEDPITWLQGSAGMGGGAGALMVLCKEVNSGDASLYLRGRDVPELESAINFDGARWTLLGGTPADHKRSKARTEILAAVADTTEPITPKDIADVTGQSRSAVRNLLAKMSRAGELEKVGNGYTIPIVPYT